MKHLSSSAPILFRRASFPKSTNERARKTRIKNADFAESSDFEKALFTTPPCQRKGGKQRQREILRKEDETKRSARIKQRKERKERTEEKEEQNGSTEVDDTHAEMPPTEAYVFKSKRLQEKQKQEENQESDKQGFDGEQPEADENIRKEGIGATDRRRLSCESLSSGQSSGSSLQRQDTENKTENQTDSGLSRSLPRRTRLPRTDKRRFDSSSEDEESSLPLAVLKKSLNDSPEKIVKRVIKVVKKVRTKSGEMKTKVVKIIKKIQVRRKRGGDSLCPVVPGKRRRRCGQCTACLIEDDCGECTFCQ